MNLYTTISGLLAAILPYLAGVFPKYKAILDGAASLATALLGYFAADAVKKQVQALAVILAQLAVAVLGWIASREDLKQTVYDKVDREAANRALVALGWLAESAVQPDRGSGLRDLGGKLEVPRGDSSPPGPTDRGPVPPEQPAGAMYRRD